MSEKIFKKISNYKNNLVVGIVGLKGSGKTLVLTILLFMAYLNGRKVYTNYRVFFPHEILDIEKMIKLDISLKNAVIGISEMHMICDARRHGKKQNILMSYFVLQSRHRSVDLYYDSQFERQVDIRIVDNTDMNIISENLYIDSDNDGYDDLFHIIFQDKRKRPLRFWEKIICGTPVFKLYDTDYIIDPFTMKEIQKQKQKEKKIRNVKSIQ